MKNEEHRDAASAKASKQKCEATDALAEPCPAKRGRLYHSTL
jgi:hypothetical protein